MACFLKPAAEPQSIQALSQSHRSNVMPMHFNSRLSVAANKSMLVLDMSFLLGFVQISCEQIYATFGLHWTPTSQFFYYKITQRALQKLWVRKQQMKANQTWSLVIWHILPQQLLWNVICHSITFKRMSASSQRCMNQDNNNVRLIVNKHVLCILHC